MSRQLFRQEAIDAQREKFLGEATIARPVPFWVFTLVAAIVALLLISVALWGQYTRRERCVGYLALETGAARGSIPDAGRVTELLIHEGDEVKAGDAMAKVSYDRTTSAGRPTPPRGRLHERSGVGRDEEPPRDPRKGAGPVERAGHPAGRADPPTRQG